MDWFTRKVPARRISSTLEAAFCVEALNEAIHRCGPPGIMTTDQGSQFTSCVWTDRLKRIGTRVSMDGEGRCMDNISIERLWRSLQDGCVYLPARETGSQAKAGIGRWITCDDNRRPHCPWRTTACRGPLQRNRNRSADAGSSSNQPDICPKTGA